MFSVILLIGQSLLADLQKANKIYKDNFKDKSTGIYLKDKVMFVVSDIDLNKYNSRHAKAKSMFMVLALIRQYCKYQVTNIVSPFDKKITSSLNIPIKITPGFKVNASSRILVNRKISKSQYRYVAAFNQKDIDVLKNKSLPPKTVKYSVEFWLNKIKYALGQSEKYNAVAKINKFYSVLGAIELMLAYNADEIAYGASIYNFPVLEKKNIDKTELILDSIENCFDVFRKYPAYIPALKQLGDLSLKKKKYYDALVFAYLSSMESSGEDLVNEAVNNLKNINENIWNEYARLIDMKRQAKSKSLLYNSKSKIAIAAYNTFGHIIPKTIVKPNQHLLFQLSNKYRKSSMDSLFKETLQYLERYNKDVKAWILLGNICFAKKSYVDVVICYNQAIFLDSERASGALVNLAYCYNNIKLKKLAVAVAWGAMLKSRPGSRDFKLAKQFLIKNSPKGIFEND